MFRALTMVALLATAGIIPATAQNKKKSEKIYPVSQFIFSYGKEHPDLPPLDTLGDLEVTLGLKDQTYVEAQEEAGETVTLHLSSLPPEAKFSRSGLSVVLQTVVKYYNDRDYYGIYAFPAASDVDPRSGRDKRKKGRTTLQISIWGSEISLIRTVGKGTRFAPEESIDHPKNALIIKKSPLHASSEAAAGSLFDKETVDHYLRRLNRHPGRQVDVALSSAGKPGEVVLDYLVSQRKPYILYGQVSNTGTESTNEWRERVGLVHYQFTNRDDILSLDFITSTFDETNALLGSYQIPLIYPNHLIFRTYGSWSEYTAEDIGASLIDFEGNTWTVGGEFLWSPFFLWGYGVDFIAGARWQDIQVDNQGSEITGGARPLTPYVGVSAQKRSQLASTFMSLRYETNVNKIDSDELSSLGRINVDRDWHVIKGDFQSSFYLEPLLFKSDWKDPRSWPSSTLAHELFLSFRGQHTFDDDRLIPQEEFIAGGFFSVRGYPESVAAGDSGFYSTAEYRYHFPRSLKPYSRLAKEDPEAEEVGNQSPFLGNKFLNKYNLRPPRVYGRPDWDLIGRIFLDYGHVENNGDAVFELENTDLLSIGVGLELQLLTNVNLRLDWGKILKGLDDVFEIPIEDATSSDSRFHFIATVSW